MPRRTQSKTQSQTQKDFLNQLESQAQNQVNGGKMKRTTSFDELINTPNTYLVIGNIRSRKPFLSTDRLPFGYSIMISHFDNGRVVLRVNVRTPNGVKSIFEMPLNDGLYEKRVEAFNFAVMLAKKLKEKYGDKIQPFTKEKEEIKFDIDQL